MLNTYIIVFLCIYTAKKESINFIKIHPREVCKLYEMSSRIKRNQTRSRLTNSVKQFYYMLHLYR